MFKLNCWEFMKCGRQPGGEKVDELGVCRATIESRTDGMNSGKMGDRACWAITGTFCDGKIQGKFTSKIYKCADVSSTASSYMRKTWDTRAQKRFWRN